MRQQPKKKLTKEQADKLWREQLIQCWHHVTAGEFEEEAKALKFAEAVQDHMARLTYAHCVSIIRDFATFNPTLVGAIESEVLRRSGITLQHQQQQRPRPGQNGETS